MRGRSRLALVVALLVLPLAAIPLYWVTANVNYALDTDKTDGVFPFEFVIGIGLPLVLATVIALWWARLKPMRALGVGVASGVVSLVAIVAALVIWCSAVDCIV
jgi:hypothetical protein